MTRSTWGPRWLEPALQVIRARYFGGRPPSEPTEAEWARASAAARAERLGPVLSEAAAHLGVALPQPGWATLTALRLQNEVRCGAHLRALDALAPAMERQGIGAVVIKGPALARHYPTAAVRQVADIDLLVPAAELAAARAILRDCGFRHWSGGGRPATRYAVTYLRVAEDGTEIAVDLHPRWHEIRIGSDGETVRVGEGEAALERADLGARRWRVLPPAVELYLTAVHSVLSSLRTISVYLDLAVLMQRRDAEALDWAARAARATGRERHLRHAVTLAAELFGVEAAPALRSRAARLGIPPGLRLGYVGPGVRFLPSSLLMELALRRGWRRKLDFVRWVLGHEGRERRSEGAETTAGGGGRRRWIERLAGLRWLKGTLLRYRDPDSVALRS